LRFPPCVISRSLPWPLAPRVLSHSLHCNALPNKPVHVFWRLCCVVCLICRFCLDLGLIFDGSSKVPDVPNFRNFFMPFSVALVLLDQTWFTETWQLVLHVMWQFTWCFLRHFWLNFREAQSITFSVDFFSVFWGWDRPNNCKPWNFNGN
jgi:hypothetical protein